MTRSSLYVSFAILGAVVPYIFFVDFLRSSGLLDFAGALFVNGAAAGFTADLLISSLVFWLWMFADAREGGWGSRMPAVCVVVNLTIGLSCALPLWLWWRSGRSAVGTVDAGRVAGIER